MRKLLAIIMVSLSGIGYNIIDATSNQAHATRPDEPRKFLDNVTVSVNNNKSITTSTTTYSPEQLAEERKQKVFDVLSLTEKKEFINKRSKNLYSLIDNWYGTPYRMGGTTKKGIDCSAFMQQIFSSVYKSSIPRTAREQYASSKKVSKNDLKEGDLVFFKIRTREVSHVGVYLADGKFAHSSSSQGVVISSLDSDYWKRYFIGGGRLENAVYSYFEN